MIRRLFLIMVFLILEIFTTKVTAAVFKIEKLNTSEKNTIIQSGVWESRCPVNLLDLRLLSISYYDFLGNVHHDGKLLINKSAAHSAIAIFKTLYRQKFPFSSVETLSEYHGNIKDAEEKNVTYGFICHQDTQGHFSQESSGEIVTINPVYNPDIHFIQNKSETAIEVFPKTAILSINRSLKWKGMTESVISIFNKNHFTQEITDKNQIGWKRFIYSKNIQTRSFTQTTPLTHFLPQDNPTFYSQALTSIQMDHLKKSGSWFDGCPVPLNRLNILTVSHYGFDGKTHSGTLIVLDAIAQQTLALFKELYQKKYPIDEFGIENQSSNSNGAMAFNCRNMVGSKNTSVHSYGLAIDINVNQNPYLGAFKLSNHQLIGTLVPPSIEGMAFLNRKIKRPGMNEKIEKILSKHGYIIWGGHWQDRIDYMHFQIPNTVAAHLILLDKVSGQKLIELIIKYPDSAKKMSSDMKWDYLYELYPNTFMDSIKKYFHLLKTQDESEVIHLIYNDLNSH